MKYLPSYKNKLKAKNSRWEHADEMDEELEIELAITRLLQSKKPINAKTIGDELEAQFSLEDKKKPAQKKYKNLVTKPKKKAVRRAKSTTISQADKRILRKSIHAEGWAAIQPKRKETPREQKKIAKRAMTKATKARPIQVMTLAEKNKKMRKRVPITRTRAKYH